MDVVLAILQMVAFVTIAAACLRPRARRRVAVLLLVLGMAALAQALLAGSEPRTLTIATTHTAYEGLNVTRKAFEVETATAPAWAWGLLCAAFALAWAAWAWRQQAAPPAGPFGAPLALAWSGAAFTLLLEKAAAPAGLVVAMDLGPDKALFPATVAAALLLARQRPRVLEMVLGLALYLGATRLALGLFGTLATQHGWGTHLDVGGIDFIAVATRPVELEPGSLGQWWWLTALPHLVVFPAIYMMSTGGLAFAVMMARKQRQVDQAVARSGSTAMVLLALLLTTSLAAQAREQDPETRTESRTESRAASGTETRSTAAAVWLTDYAQARKVAEAEGKDLLLAFVGYDWCNWCQRLRHEVFQKESFRQKAPRAFVLVQVDLRRHRRQQLSLAAQNRQLRRKFGIDAYPTIYLADAAGRPYARSGYREVGPEIYLGHLLELQEIRKKRDDEFLKAAGAKGPERAGYLAAGLEALGGRIPLDDYLPVIDEILALDPDDQESLRTRYTEVKRRVLRARAMRELTRQLDALAQQKQWAKIRAAVARFSKQHEPTGHMLQELVWIEAVSFLEQGHKQQAREKFAEVRRLDPDSDLGRQARKALQSLGN